MIQQTPAGSWQVKLLVVSDTHGQQGGLRAALDANRDAAALLFLGDGLRDLEAVRRTGPCPMIYEVRGNCDYDLQAPLKRLVSFGGVLFFLSHGYQYHVKGSCRELCQTAARQGADVALFGHTHTPFYGELNGIRAFNPGSAGAPRAGSASYGVITITGGVPEFEHRKLELP